MLKRSLNCRLITFDTNFSDLIWHKGWDQPAIKFFIFFQATLYICCSLRQQHL